MIGKSIWLSSASRSRKSSYSSSTTSFGRPSGRSILFTTATTGRRRSSALRSTKRVWGSGPSLASTRSSTPSTMASARSTSPPKSAWPGVSTMLSFIPPCRTAVFLARMVMPFSRSRSIESSTRTATSWFSRNTPDCHNMASTSVVLPWSTCATMARLRRSRRVSVMAGSASAALEGRLPLLEPGADPLGGIGARRRESGQLVDVVVGEVGGSSGGADERPFHGPERERGEPGDGADDRLGLRLDLPVGDRPGDDAERCEACPRHRLADKEHLGGERAARHLDQLQHERPRRREPDAGERHRETRRLRRDDEVTVEGQLGAPGHGVAADGRHDRERVLADGGEGRLDQGLTVAEAREVDAGAEHRPCGREDRHPFLATRLGREGLPQRGEHGGVEGVALLGAVELHASYAVLDRHLHSRHPDLLLRALPARLGSPGGAPRAPRQPSGRGAWQRRRRTGAGPSR